MRPVSEVHQALMQAARTLVAEMGQPNRGATLAELEAAVGKQHQVGRGTVRTYVANMKRCGALQIVAERRVDYRNRPVAEYAPAVDDAEPIIHAGCVVLGACMAGWAR